jgi:hypothetical protein
MDVYEKSIYIARATTNDYSNTEEHLDAALKELLIKYYDQFDNSQTELL